MEVRVDFVLPERYYSENQKCFINHPENEHLKDWLNHHDGFLRFDWEVIPNVGEVIDLLTENGSEICAIVKNRTWIPSLWNGANQNAIFIEAEIKNPDDGNLDGPLYDKRQSE